MLPWYERMQIPKCDEIASDFDVSPDVAVSDGTPVENIEERLRTLEIVLDGDIRYQLDSVFPKLAGWGSDREIRSRATLIQTVEPTLKRILNTAEEVRYIARGRSFVIALTNVRLLIMRSSTDGKLEDQFWAVFYSEIVDFKSNWNGCINLVLRDQRTPMLEAFSQSFRVSSLDRRSIIAIVQSGMNEFRLLNLVPITSRSCETLCSHCFDVVPMGDFVCDNCGTEYWKPVDLAFRSMCSPMWGNICKRHGSPTILSLLSDAGGWAFTIFFFRQLGNQFGIAAIACNILLNHTTFAAMNYGFARDGLFRRRAPVAERVASLNTGYEQDM